jgi:hypothetical protein
MVNILKNNKKKKNFSFFVEYNVFFSKKNNLSIYLKIINFSIKISFYGA